MTEHILLYIRNDTSNTRACVCAQHIARIHYLMHVNKAIVNLILFSVPDTLANCILGKRAKRGVFRCLELKLFPKVQFCKKNVIKYLLLPL